MRLGRPRQVGVSREGKALAEIFESCVHRLCAPVTGCRCCRRPCAWSCCPTHPLLASASRLALPTKSGCHGLPTRTIQRSPARSAPPFIILGCALLLALATPSSYSGVLYGRSGHPPHRAGVCSALCCCPGVLRLARTPPPRPEIERCLRAFNFQLSEEYQVKDPHKLIRRSR